jgi:hypothetical protein
MVDDPPAERITKEEYLRQLAERNNGGRLSNRRSR